MLAGLLGLSVFILMITGHVAALLPGAVFLLSAAACAGVSEAKQGKRGKALLASATALVSPLATYWLLPDPMALIPLTLVLAISATHLPFYRYVAQKRNSAFAIAVVPMQVIFFLGCAISIPIAYIKHYPGNRRAQPDENSSTGC